MSVPAIRAALLRNPRAHAYRRGRRPPRPPPDVVTAEPHSPNALASVLREWAAAGITRLIVDGGDGTVRELLGALPEAFCGRKVELAVLPAGKTNALAHDLRRGRRLDLDAALRSPRATTRTPVEIVRGGDETDVQRGFVFGMGVFVDAIRLAQPFHRAGLFGGLAVGAALAGVGARMLFGAPSDAYRKGRRMQVERDGVVGPETARFLFLLSTLERLPLGLRPFGPERSGLKLLDVEAPPCRLMAALLPVLSGAERAWLADAGYHRADVQELRLSAAGPFILDGELFDGGDLLIRRGAPITFVLP